KLLRRTRVANFQATNVAVSPIAISPYPAGKAKMAGRPPRASSRTKVNPTILQDWARVRTCGFKDNTNWRNFSEVANHSTNTRIGVTAAAATARPIRFASFLNHSDAEAYRAKRNHMAI